MRLQYVPGFSIALPAPRRRAYEAISGSIYMYPEIALIAESGLGTMMLVCIINFFDFYNFVTVGSSFKFRTRSP